MTGPRPDIVDLVWRALERDNTEAPRTYLGASAVGAECERQLWYTFRHVGREKFPGRVLRLFETGHLEEARFARDLRSIGIEVEDVDPVTGRQWAYSAFGGHGRGHGDGRVRGVPGFPDDEWMLVEMKTHSAKSFAHMQAHGVYASKPQHYAQMQIYMHLGKFQHGLYLAKNKDDDDLYMEVVPYCEDDAKHLMARWGRIIFAEDPPAQVSGNPAVPPCRWCPLKDHCHGGAPAAVSCRTCAHARPEQDGSWFCQAGHKFGRSGCEHHQYHPHLVPLSTAERIHADGTIEYRSRNGRKFSNGPSGMTSEQMHSQQPWSVKDEPKQRKTRAWSR